MQSLFRDIRYVLRSLRRSPAFAVVALLSLTMAIAANVVAFGVLDALIIHPLPVEQPRQIYTVQGKETGNLNVSYPDYRDIRRRLGGQGSTLRDVAVARIVHFGLDQGAGAQPVWGYEASGNYFSLLGVRPVLGRFFEDTDEHGVNSAPYAVLSYAAWRSLFAGDHGVVGRTVLINKHRYTLLGVAPPRFEGTERFFAPVLWVPMMNAPQVEGFDSLEARGTHGLWAIARLNRGATVAQANAELNNISAQLRRQYPATDHSLTLCLTKPGLLGDLLGGPMRAFVGGILLLAGLVLLAACANLGGLIAARTAERTRELGIRLAIGASRTQLLRSLFTETLLTTLLSAAAASLVAKLVLHALTRFRPAIGLPIQVVVDASPLAYAFALTAAVTSGVLLGLLPVRSLWQIEPQQAVRSSPGVAVHGRRLALRDVLLVLQVALCCVLVTASLVALRGLRHALTTPLGIRPQGVVTATFDLHLAGYSEQQSAAIQRRILDAVMHLPGVIDAAYGNTTPLSPDTSTTAIYPVGTVDLARQHPVFGANYFDISPGYLRTAGTRLLAGREFTWHDDAKAPPVAIVNQTFARRLFGTRQALDRRFVQGNQTMRIVGVVEDGKYSTLTEDSMATLFIPIQQSPSSETALLVRAAPSADSIAPAILHALQGIDPGLPITAIGSWQARLQSFVLLPARAASIALGVLGSLAIMLAATGIFGLASYTVGRRMREFGIRVALGAQRSEVLRAALGRVGWLLGLGSLAGLLLGTAASRILTSIVLGAQGADPVVLTSAAAVMVAIGLLATWLPARHALDVEPAQLLRTD